MNPSGLRSQTSRLSAPATPTVVPPEDPMAAIAEQVAALADSDAPAPRDALVDLRGAGLEPDDVLRPDLPDDGADGAIDILGWHTRASVWAPTASGPSAHDIGFNVPAIAALVPDLAHRLRDHVAGPTATASRILVEMVHAHEDAHARVAAHLWMLSVAAGRDLASVYRFAPGGYVDTFLTDDAYEEGWANSRGAIVAEQWAAAEHGAEVHRVTRRWLMRHLTAAPAGYRLPSRGSHDTYCSQHLRRQMLRQIHHAMGHPAAGEDAEFYTPLPPVAARQIRYVVGHTRIGIAPARRAA